MAEVWTVQVCPECGESQNATTCWCCREPDGSEKACEPVDVIPKAQADDLVKALEPFGESYFADCHDEMADDEEVSINVAVGQIRTARAALDAYETEER